MTMKDETGLVVDVGGAPVMSAFLDTSNPTEIFPLCKECLKEFQKLTETLEGVTFDEGVQRGYDVDTALTAAEEGQSRFKAWAINIAALQRGHLRSSLDFRLKDATEIRTRILKVLKDLVQSISSVILIVTGVQTNETWQIGALSDSEDEAPKTPDQDVVETSDLQELFAAMTAANTSLMKMSMVIRNSPGRDDYLKAATRYPFDPKWDIGHVKEKHGSENRSSDWLLERLGKAITRRRQYLKYREDHHGKLSRDWEAPKETEADDEPAKTIALTEATKYVENEVPNQRPGSDGGGSFGSQTSYEATIVGESTEIRLTVPPPPMMAFQDQGIPFTFGEAFQCPYCYTEQTVKNKAAWKKHVFRDLKPYVCTFKECNLRMFRSRNEWFTHELQAHRREWTCPRCQAAPFSTKASFETHLKTAHKALLTGSELEAVILQSEEPVDRISSSACNLCDDWQSSVLNTNKASGRAFLNEGKDVKPYGTIKQFRRHLGRHMEQLALFALPMHENEEVEDESSDDDEDGADLVIDDSAGERDDLTHYVAPVIIGDQQLHPRFITYLRKSKQKIGSQHSYNTPSIAKSDSVEVEAKVEDSGLKDYSGSFPAFKKNRKEEVQQKIPESESATARARALRTAVEVALRRENQEVLRALEAKGKSPEADRAKVEIKKKPIKFQDAVGRKFSFPFHLCQTWAGMEALINQAFLHVDVIDPHVMAGHYDLVGPNGEIILPQVWETMIEPDWSITMQMWPMPEKPPTSPTTYSSTDRSIRPPRASRLGPPPPPPPRHQSGGMPPPLPPGWPGGSQSSREIPTIPVPNTETPKSNPAKGAGGGIFGWMAGAPAKSSAKKAKKW